MKLKDFGTCRDQRLLYFHCPGCNYGHAYEVPRWTWNGSFDKPTFTPSLLINAFHPPSRCHLFMTDGKIQFCGDCSHSLAGQVVEIPDVDETNGGPNETITPKSETIPTKIETNSAQGETQEVTP